MTLHKKLIAFIVLPVIVCTSVIVILSSIKIQKQGINDLIDKSNSILNLSILEFVHNHIEGNAVVEMDIEEVLKGVTSKIDSTHQQYTFRIAAPNASNENHKANANDLVYFNRFVNENIIDITHVDESNNELLVIRPVYMMQLKVV